VKKRSGRRAK